MRALRLAVALTVAALVTVGFAGAANAQATGDDYPTEVCAVTNNVQPSATVSLECTGFPAGTTVTITLDGQVLGEAVVAADGTIAFSFPAPATCGNYALAVTDGATTQATTLTIACSPAAAVTTAGTLPYTGSDSSLPLVQIGAGLLAAGAVIMLTVRKRQSLAHAKVDA